MVTLEDRITRILESAAAARAIDPSTVDSRQRLHTETGRPRRYVAYAAIVVFVVAAAALSLARSSNPDVATTAEPAQTGPRAFSACDVGQGRSEMPTEEELLADLRAVEERLELLVAANDPDSAREGVAAINCLYAPGAVLHIVAGESVRTHDLAEFWIRNLESRDLTADNPPFDVVELDASETTARFAAIHRGEGYVPTILTLEIIDENWLITSVRSGNNCDLLPAEILERLHENTCA